jgi:hypothetical protein
LCYILVLELYNRRCVGGGRITKFYNFTLQFGYGRNRIRVCVTIYSQNLCQLPYIRNLTLAKFSSALKAVHSFRNVIIYLTLVSSANGTNGSRKCTAPARYRSELSYHGPMRRALYSRTSTKEFSTVQE